MYYIKKIFRMILSVFSIGTLSFLLLELIPGEPETTILGVEASAKDLENLREQLGLNLSFGTRYWNWLCGVFQGDRKSTRLNSSHQTISYAVFCLKEIPKSP